ncbi:MAG: S8 family serine peptidase [Planctomycetota bacterium]
MTLSLLAPIAVLWTAPLLAQEAADERPLLSSMEELPAARYELELPVLELVAADAQLRALADAVAADLADLFEQYRLAPALEKELAQRALHAAIVREEWEEAARYLSRARSLEEREDLRLVAGLHFEAWIAVRTERDGDPDALRALYAERLRALVEQHPWDVVRHEIGRRAAKTSFLSEGLLQMAMRSTLGSAVGGGEVDGESARMFLMLANGVRIMLPLKHEISGAYGAYMEAHERAFADLWSQREVALDADGPGAPVRIAVWDTGVDVDLFGGQLWTNSAETPNGLDDDGNGFVDDVHGIAYGPDLRPTPELLYARHPDDEVWARVLAHDEGLSDLLASIDSPAARDLQATMGALSAEEAPAFVELLGHYAMHVHGTHVAGIAVAGNPFARLVVARVGLDHREPGERMTLAWAHRFAAMCHETVAYFRASGVRVVNMSWGWGVAEIDENLAATGYEGTDADRRAHARAIHTVLAEAIESSLRSAPEILFVCGAGNSGKDSSTDRFVPSALRLPNLVTVGGVDSACEMTAFTSFGDHVRLYANGYQVESYVPGGERRPQSGTSMSSPQVANLAGKLLALQPELTPRELVERMERCAERKRFAGNEVFIVDPMKSLQQESSTNGN